MALRCIERFVCAREQCRSVFIEEQLRDAEADGEVKSATNKRTGESSRHPWPYELGGLVGCMGLFVRLVVGIYPRRHACVAPQQRLNFVPLPHQHGSLRPVFSTWRTRGFGRVRRLAAA